MYSSIKVHTHGSLLRMGRPFRTHTVAKETRTSDAIRGCRARPSYERRAAASPSGLETLDDSTSARMTHAAASRTPRGTRRPWRSPLHHKATTRGRVLAEPGDKREKKVPRVAPLFAGTNKKGRRARRHFPANPEIVCGLLQPAETDWRASLRSPRGRRSLHHRRPGATVRRRAGSVL
jgi:hypothetical protein